MDLGVTDKVRPLIAAVRAMVRDEIMPLEEEYDAEVGREGDRFKPTARMIEIRESLKAKARSEGLWNFWLTGSDRGYGLTTVEYAYLAEEMGMVSNCLTLASRAAAECTSIDSCRTSFNAGSVYAAARRASAVASLPRSELCANSGLDRNERVTTSCSSSPFPSKCL